MKHTIFNNYYSRDIETNTRQFLLDEYGDENGWKSINDIPDNDVWEEMNFQEEINWDDAKAEMKEFFDGGYFLLYGSFGGWRGRQPAGKVIKNFTELCDSWRECDYINLYDENGHFYIECSHHDGTNYYEVKLLTTKGVEYLNNGWNWHDKDAHEKVFNCNLFSALPHFAHKVYGCKKYA